VRHLHEVCRQALFKDLFQVPGLTQILDGRPGNRYSQKGSGLPVLGTADRQGGTDQHPQPARAGPVPAASRVFADEAQNDKENELIMTEREKVLYDVAKLIYAADFARGGVSPAKAWDAAEAFYREMVTRLGEPPEEVGDRTK
jgi:hypothetical protein